MENHKRAMINDLKINRNSESSIFFWIDWSLNIWICKQREKKNWKVLNRREKKKWFVHFHDFSFILQSLHLLEKQLIYISSFERFVWKTCSTVEALTKKLRVDSGMHFRWMSSQNFTKCNEPYSLLETLQLTCKALHSLSFLFL